MAQEATTATTSTLSSRTRRNCCRLCLAPDNECISILNSFAADKEPLVVKIQNCVNIKITSNDHLSLRICHHCISYLNSWQSFKNRCLSAQNKQRSWFGSAEKRSFQFDNNLSITTSSALNQQQQQDELQQAGSYDNEEQQHHSSLSASILDGISTLKKRKSLTVYPLPAVQIKDEPVDEDEFNKPPHDETDDIMDPTLFLERTEVEGEEALQSSNFDYSTNRTAVALNACSTPIDDTKDAKCRACNLTFSTRANARRHERNLHPNLFKALNTPIQQQRQPSAALQAALQLQRASGGALDITRTSINSTPGTTSLTTDLLHSYVKKEVDTSNELVNYDEPENHRHLLTDEKIIFMLQNEEFLQQYQKMTCRCCNRHYDTYKNFMAHMRKKYTTLPRNLCFNCLKLNGSKALFISHLKRRNCVNLYRLLQALMEKNEQFAAAVAATASGVPEKMRAKELLVNKTYECKLCPKQFRLKLEFRTHVNEKHCDLQRREATPNQCIFCALVFEDATERKRHYNNMDCIVMLRCGTCDAKFENHQKFLDHVYQKHLSGFGEQSPAAFTSGNGQERINSNKLSMSASGIGGAVGGGASSTDESRHSISLLSNVPKTQYFSRMPQACPICGQQYNNYNNVLRHMESKHPDQLPQTYKCVKCGIGYPRLSNLREHMASVHAAEKTRQSGFDYIVNAEATKAADSKSYTGRYDYVMKDLMSITNGGTSAGDEDDEAAEQSAKKMRLDSNGTAAVTSQTSSMKECPVCKATFNNNIGLSNHMRSHTAAALNAATANANLSNNRTSAGNSNVSANTPDATSNATAMLAHQNAVQQAILKRSLDQAADRRFRRMRCRICQRRFSSKKSYRYHMLKDHQIRNVQFIKCKLCDAEFAYEKGLKVHMFKIHNTLMKDEMMIKQYECDICSLVYGEEQQLLLHKRSAHGNEQAQALLLEQSTTAAATANLSGLSTPVGSDVGINNNSVLTAAASALDNAGSTGPLYWYQCKYCPSNFNTNKKLAIHINSHDEFDSNDYSCKDCGNVYSGRKSLWVHRYKKHPQIPAPAECVLCKKVFFDGQMLAHHKPTCNRKPITATGALAEESAMATPTAALGFRHKTGDDDDESATTAAAAAADNDSKSAQSIPVGTLGGGEVEVSVSNSNNSSMRMKIPEVACAMCGKRYTDQELFTKHLEMHEKELYTDNPLAAMFDMGPTDPNQFYLDRVNDMGEYACDLCPKTFTQMTALKVHRKWHFRGDSKQNATSENDISSVSANSLNIQTTHLRLQGLQAIGLMPIAQQQSQQQQQQQQQQLLLQQSNRMQSMKNQKIKRELKCEYCTSTFISNNNLRRHMYELHQDEVGNLPKPPKINTDPYLQCRRCNMLSFNSKTEWIEHKVAEARVTKPFGPFQWGCDLCGAYVSRKEKLINHIYNHAKEREIVPVSEQKLRQQQQQQHQQQQQQQEQQQQTMFSLIKSENQVHVKDEELEQPDIDDEMESDNDDTSETEQDDDEQQPQQQQHQDDEEDEQQSKSDEQPDDSTEEQDDDNDNDDEDEEQAAANMKLQSNVQQRNQRQSEEQSGSSNSSMPDEDDAGIVEEQMDYEDEQENDNDEATNSDSNQLQQSAALNAAGNELAVEDDDDDDDEDDDDENENDDDENDDEDDDVDNIIEMVEDTYDEDGMNEANGIATQYVADEEDTKIQAYETQEDDEASNAFVYEDSSNSQQLQQQNYNDNSLDSATEAAAAGATVRQSMLKAEMLSTDDDEQDEDEEDDDDVAAEEEVEALKPPSYPCELCQAGFQTQLELQRHVKLHFLNGPGSVKFAEMRPQGSLNKSRSSSSSTDVLSVTLS